MHRLAPEVKIAAMVLFTVAVVATPREAFWAFGGYAVAGRGGGRARPGRPGWLAAGADRAAVRAVRRARCRSSARASGSTWLGLSLSVDGLYGAWNIVAKGTLGVLASLLLAGDHHHPGPDLGLDRLRCPQMITQIATFMLRYLDVLATRPGGCGSPGCPAATTPGSCGRSRRFADGVGALFLRAFERGERVYLAMVSRGYAGRMPALAGRRRRPPGSGPRAAACRAAPSPPRSRHRDGGAAA